MVYHQRPRGHRAKDHGNSVQRWIERRLASKAKGETGGTKKERDDAIAGNKVWGGGRGTRSPTQQGGSSQGAQAQTAGRGDTEFANTARVVEEH